MRLLITATGLMLGAILVGTAPAQAAPAAGSAASALATEKISPVVEKVHRRRWHAYHRRPRVYLNFGWGPRVYGSTYYRPYYYHQPHYHTYRPRYYRYGW